jgi:hypothetical protein
MRIAILTLRFPDTLFDQGRQSGTRLLLAEMQTAARQMGVGLTARAIANADELPDAFAQFRREQAQAVFVQVNPLTLQNRPTLTELAAR